MISVSIVIVSWHSKEFIAVCINSIPEACAGLAYEVIVIDNASGDGSAGYLANQYPGIKLIKNSVNRGFAAACNQGADLAQGKYLFILNPDTILSTDCVKKMVEFIEKQSWAGIVGPQLLDRKKRVQNSVRRFPSLIKILIRDTVLGKIVPVRSKERLITKLPNDCPVKVDQVSGAAFLIKRELWQALDGMDNRFFMFYEEVDLCFRVKEMGYDVFYLPMVHVNHCGGGSRHQARNKVFCYNLRSMFLYFEKRYGKRIAFLYKCVYKPLFLIELGFDLIFTSRDKLSYKVKRDFLKQDLKEFLLEM